MNSRIGIDEDALRGQPLRAVAGNCVSVIKVAMINYIEFDLPAIVEAREDLSIGVRLNQ